MALAKTQIIVEDNLLIWSLGVAVDWLRAQRWLTLRVDLWAESTEKVNESLTSAAVPVTKWLLELVDVISIPYEREKQRNQISVKPSTL